MYIICLCIFLNTKCVLSEIPVDIKIFFSAIKCFSFFTVCFCGYSKLLLSLLSLPILYPGWAQQPQAYMAHLNYWCFPKSNLETELVHQGEDCSPPFPSSSWWVLLFAHCPAQTEVLWFWGKPRLCLLFSHSIVYGSLSSGFGLA